MKHDFHVREQIHRQIWAAIMSQWPMGEAWMSLKIKQRLNEGGTALSDAEQKQSGATTP